MSLLSKAFLEKVSALCPSVRRFFKDEYRHPPHSEQPFRRRAGLLITGLWSVFVVCLTSSVVQAQEQMANGRLEPVDYTIPAEGYVIPDYSGSLNAQPTQRRVGGFGTKGRIGHEAGNTVGRRGSLTYFDLSPYMFTNNGIIFGDGRLFVNNQGRMGGSAGLGARQFLPKVNSVVGATFYYDRDDSRSVTFEQFSIAGEILTELFDIRANYHIPIGTETEVTAVRFEPGSQQFVGNGILFQNRTFASTTLEGLDLTFTTPIRGEFAQRHNLEASAGWYHYEPSAAGLEQVDGWKLRLDADVAQFLSHMFLEFTSDNTFDDNIVFGVDVNYWDGLDRAPRVGQSQYHRLADWVRRTRTVSTVDASAVGAPMQAINPVTGAPYLVLHVRNNPNPPPVNFPSPTGDGSLEMPFQYIQDAINDPQNADIVFVQANSVFDADIDGNSNATVVMREDLLVLGEGVQLTIPVVGLADEITLPTATDPTGPFETPILRDGFGPIVTMADNSRFAGFQILNTQSGFAIDMDGIEGAEINEVVIDIDPTDPLDPANPNAPTGSGIRINDSTGLIQIENVEINNTLGNAFQVTGGDASIVFAGMSSINNTSGFSVFIQDAAGSVNMRSLAITGVGGAGVEVSGTTPTLSTANITFDAVNLANTASPDGSFRIFNHAGGLSVLGLTSISGGTGPAIAIDQLQPTGSVTFQGTTNVNNRTFEGIRISNIQEGDNPFNPGQLTTGTVLFQGPVSVLQGTGTGSLPAIAMQSSIGNVIFNGSVNVNGGLVEGITVNDLLDVGETDGQFIFNGFTSINNFGGTGFNVSDIAKENFFVRTGGMTIDNRGIVGVAGSGVGINVSNTVNTNQFFNSTIIANQNGVISNAASILSNTGTVSFGSLSARNVLGPGAFGVRVFDNFNPGDADARVSFSAINVESTGATGVSIVENEVVSIATGDLDITDARAIEVIGFDPLVTTDVQEHTIILTSIDAQDVVAGIDTAILVEDSQGGFTVTGSGVNPGSGGLIQGYDEAGARFTNTQLARLTNVDFDANFRGVDARNLVVRRNGFNPGLFLTNVTITDSNAQAIRAISVSDFILNDSFLSNNGFDPLVGPNNHQIFFSAELLEADIDGDGLDDDPDDLIEYNVEISESTIADSPANAVLTEDMVVIQSFGLGNGAPLNFELLDNGIPGLVAVADMIGPNRPGNAGIRVNWTGDADINMDQNTFILGASINQTGILVNVDGLADITYSNNSLASSGFNNTGLRLVLEDQSFVDIRDNVVLDADDNFVPGSGFQMAGVNSTAIDLTFQGSNNNIFLARNFINMTGVDSTGINFERIFAPSNVTINSNAIFLITDFDAVREEGIIFRDVRGVINLFGSINNQIPIGTQFPFFVDFLTPAGATNGSIIVNGVARP